MQAGASARTGAERRTQQPRLLLPAPEPTIAFFHSVKTTRIVTQSTSILGENALKSPFCLRALQPPRFPGPGEGRRDPGTERSRQGSISRCASRCARIPSSGSACLAGFAADCSKQHLTVGSSGSICAPWSLISMLRACLWNGHLPCSPLSVLHAQLRRQLCLVFGSGSSEAGGNYTPQLATVTWLLLTHEAVGQIAGKR